jgi:hypothetical protein
MGICPSCAEIQEKALLEMILSKIEQFNAFDLSQTIWGEKS